MARLIPLSKVSARLATSDDTVRRMMTRGQLPIATYQLPTGTLRFDADELEQWLESCKLAANPQPAQEGGATSNHQEHHQ